MKFPYSFKKGFTPTPNLLLKFKQSFLEKLGFKKTTNLVWGFTLVEVLVVISIMGILTAIVYSSFSGAKVQSRDQQKITDTNAIQLALEVYFNQNHQYPSVLSTLVPTYMPGIPTSGSYNYFPITNVAPNSPICTSYQLSVTLEANNSYLQSKKGFDSTGVNQCLGGTGTPVNAGTLPLLYDVTP